MSVLKAVSVHQGDQLVALANLLLQRLRPELEQGYVVLHRGLPRRPWFEPLDVGGELRVGRHGLPEQLLPIAHWVAPLADESDGRVSLTTAGHQVWISGAARWRYRGVRLDD